MTTRAMPKGAKSDGEAGKQALVKRLQSGLSDEELQQVGASALRALDRRGLERLAGSLPKDTGTTLRKLMGTSGKRPESPRQATSAERIRQEWEQAWGEWDSCVAESGDEDGNYVVREHHWEAPYADLTALAGDLEPIAAKMRPMSGRVFDGNLDPGFSFAEALVDTVKEIGAGLPDWLDPFEGDGMGFGPQVTGCLMDWEWRAVRRRRANAFEFADAICRLEAETENLGLDEDVVARFILGLPEPDRADIRRGISERRQSGHWEKVLKHASSGWFRIFQKLCRQGDPSRFLEDCRSHVSQDWRLALPVLKELAGKRRFQEALSLGQSAVGTLLSLPEGESWDPKDDLLIRHGVLRYREARELHVNRLLEHWRRASRALGQGDTASALELQQVFWERWTDWDSLLLQARRITTSPEAQAISDRLFAQWRSLVAGMGVTTHFDGHVPSGEHWVHALIDAARVGEGSQEAFHRAVSGWLMTVEKSPVEVRRGFGPLARLTLDLDVGSRLRQACPTLGRILRRYSRGDDPVEASRRRWLRRLEPDSLWAEVIDFWRRNAVHLVPDPAQSQGSTYDACAEWLAAVFELDPGRCRDILRQWTVMHRRRRNLWQALAKRKLPLAGAP